jgi:hypothetical protein
VIDEELERGTDDELVIENTRHLTRNLTRNWKWREERARKWREELERARIAGNGVRNWNERGLLKMMR